jgi:pimeloyl-ACP methyl ester carboxylesterase
VYPLNITPPTVQGRDDPLNDAVGRANQMDAACPNVTLNLIKAGHCPHDEAPQLVNAAIIDWATAEVFPAGQTPAVAVTS